MDMRLDHPELLGTFEGSAASRLRWWCGLCLSLWLLLLALDWAARVRMFRWQDQWLPEKSRSAASSPAERTYQMRTVPGRMGGGLARMVPVQQVAARYEEYLPEHVQPVDPWGYANAPIGEDGYYPVVMLGDSFMVSLGTQTLAQALADISGVPVYNHGRQRTGPFQEMEKFILSDRFAPLPRVVIWNLLGRELGAPLFLRQPVEAWFAGMDIWAHARERPVRTHVRWDRLSADALRRDWPDSSILAFAGRRIWAQARMVGFREWPPDVLGVEDPEFGPMLFYRENLRVLPSLTAGTNAQAIIRVISRLSQGFQERGMTLVVLLVPEREQMYLRALPPEEQAGLMHGSELMEEIESRLTREGTPVVNLMPIFRNATEQGRRLYWRDDTHWNDAGIRLAAEEIWKVVEPLLGEKSGDRGDPRSEVR